MTAAVVVLSVVVVAFGIALKYLYLQVEELEKSLHYIADNLERKIYENS